MPAGPDATALQVLRHLVDHGPLSRPDLQQGTGLARATTSAITNDLLRRGLLAEIDTPRSGQRGRPVTLLDLDDTHYAVTGIEIGFDKILASVHTLQGRELLRVERPAEADAVNPRALLRRAAMVLQETLDLVEDDGRELLGVGVSVAGLVDAASGTIKYAPSLGWRDIALSEGVAEALGGRAPVLIDTTANYAALAELRERRRNGGTEASLVYLTGTYGISAGIVAGGNLWRGERGMAGEVGHLIVEADGLRCVCGRNGCLDTRAGMSAILDAALGAAKGVRRTSRPLTLSAGVDQVASLAQSGDQGVVEALAEAGRWLGRGAALVCAMLDPHSVVLGGHYARLAPWLLVPARGAFRESLLLPGDDREQLQVSALGAWAPVEGAALAVLLSYADGTRAFPSSN
ncbi:putative NBD/HSP70 family sugar kinase [Streptacidiphilus sp. MAP12-33]|uniref:ROK family transcriptional regulator n=1 Tax=Streptacidiphilus sp. MAP12-33 TaxID=3156266 RepID=UPI003519762F